MPLDAWCEYIHWGCKPMRAFAVPCIINEYEWHDASLDKGLIFDRIRIVNLLQNGVQDIDFRQELK